MPMKHTGNAQALRWIEAARTVAPEFVWGPLSESAHAALAGVCDLRVSISDNIRAPFVAATLPDGSTRLVLNAALPTASRDLVRLFVCFQHWRPLACPRPEQALLAAAAGVLHAEGLRGYGVAWQVQMVEEMKEATPLWEIASLHSTLMRLNDLTPAACPEPVSASDDLAPRDVYELGREARTQGDFAMAAALLNDAVRRAGLEGDGETLVLSLNARGVLEYRLGNVPAARRNYARAAKECARQGVPRLAWGPLHDLFVLETQEGRHAVALRHALAAYEAYGDVHPNILRFAHDVVWYLVEAGYYLRALPLARLLAAAFAGHGEHIRALATLAHAAGGAGDRVAVECAGCQVEDTALSTEPVANALVQMARGYLLASMYDRAEAAAHRAMEVATHNGERGTKAEAEAVAQAASRRDQLPRRRIRLRDEEEGQWDELVSALSTAVAQRLTRHPAAVRSVV